MRTNVGVLTEHALPFSMEQKGRIRVPEGPKPANQILSDIGVKPGWERGFVEAHFFHDEFYDCRHSSVSYWVFSKLQCVPIKPCEFEFSRPWQTIRIS